MRLDVEYLEFMWPMRHFLITCGGGAGSSANIIAVSFCMPVSKSPPLIACAIGKDAYSRKLIEFGMEFVVNVPAKNLQVEVYYCGFNSGADVDKFKETGMTPGMARRVNPPIIEECVAFMECKVRQSFETGDKIMFIGEVLEAYADEEIAVGKTEFEYAVGDFPRKVYGGRFR